MIQASNSVARRSERLATLIDDVGKIFLPWQETPTNMCEVPPKGLYESIELMLAEWLDGEVTPDLQPLVPDMQALCDELRRQKARMEQYGDDSWPLSLTPHLCKIFPKLDTLRQIKVQPLGTVSEMLKEHGGDYEQVALRFGWFNLMGYPDTRMVREEEAEPGRHTGPESGWVPPLVARERTRVQKIVDQCSEILKRIDLRNKAKKATPGIKELIDQGVSLSQIALMHGKKPMELQAEIIEHGWPMPPMEYSTSDYDFTPAGLSKQFDEVIKAELANSTSPHATDVVESPAVAQSADETFEHQVVALGGAGFSAEEIAAHMSSPAHRVSQRKVKAILNQHAKDLEQAE